MDKMIAPSGFDEGRKREYEFEYDDPWVTVQNRSSNSGGGEPFNPNLELDGQVTVLATGKEPIDSGLYYKDGGQTPLYVFEGGECDYISYAFLRPRLIPIRESGTKVPVPSYLYDSISDFEGATVYYTKPGRRVTARAGDRVIPGGWKLVADLGLKIQRTITFKYKAPANLEELPQAQREFYDRKVIQQTFKADVATNIVLATSKLVYKSRACEQTKGKPPGIDYDHYFEVDEIEALEGLTITQNSPKETGKFLEDEFGDSTIPIYEKIAVADRIKLVTSLGDDTCWVATNPDGTIALHNRPITQHIMWAESKVRSRYSEADEEAWNILKALNGKALPSWIEREFKGSSLFLEPPTGFLGSSSTITANWLEERRQLYYGGFKHSNRGNDTILIARRLEKTAESYYNFDANWLNFNSDRKKTDHEMYVSFIDPTWIPEMGSPDFSTQAVPMKEPGTGRTIYIRYLTKQVEYPDDQSLEDVWNIINGSATINTSVLDYKVNAATKTIGLLSKIPTIKGLYSQTVPIKKLRSKTIMLNDGSTFTNEGSDPAYWKIGTPSYPNGWYAVTDPRTSDQGGTGYVGYVKPKVGPNGELLDMAGNILKGASRSRDFQISPTYNTKSSHMAGSIGCPPLTSDKYGIWTATESGLILNDDYRYGDENLTNNEYAMRSAYVDLLTKRKNRNLSADPNSRIASLNPGFIVERGKFSDDRKFFQPYGPTPAVGNYFFRDIRFAPTYSEIRGKGDRIIGYDRTYNEVGNKIIPGPWNLIADLYLYIPTFGASGLVREFVGILYPDYILSRGVLHYEINKDCEGIYGWNSVKYEYRFPVSEIESYRPLIEAGFANHATNLAMAVGGVKKVINGILDTPYGLGATGLKPGDEILTRDGDMNLVVSRTNNLRFFPDYVEPQYRVRTDPQVIDKPFTDNRAYNPNGTEVGFDYFQQLSSYKYEDSARTLVGNLIKQNKFETINLPQPYDFRNEKYWSYSFGTLPVLIDNEPAGVFGELIQVNASSNYITTRPISNFKNKVVGETPCVSGSWDFRSEIPKNPVQVETLNLLDCADAPFDIIFNKKRLTVDRLPDTETLYPIEPGPAGFDIPIITRTKNVEESDSFLSRDPNSPCFQGFKTTYDISDYYEVTMSKLCWQPVSEEQAYEPDVIFDGVIYKKYTALYSGSIDIVKTKEVRWENPESVFCDCIEVKVAETPFLDPDDPCGCKEIHLDSVYKICVDDGLYYYENQIIPPNKLPIRTEQRFGISTECGKVKVKVMHDLDFQKDIIFAKNKLYSKGLFNGTDILSCYATSSKQLSGSKQYYYDVINCNECNSDSYFAVSYGHLKGSGSTYNYYEEDDTPTRSVYSQYRLLTLEEPQTKFQFYKTGSLGTDLEDIYVLNFYRHSMEDRLDPGNFELSLVELNGGAYSNNIYTGSNVQVSASNKIITLIDNSGDTTNQAFCVDSPYTSFDLVSGSLVGGIYGTTTTTYGTIYPLLGIVVLDAGKLNKELSFNTVTGSNVNGDNHYKLYTSISGASARNFPMRVRTSTNKTTTEYFIRIPHTEANYSNNPTFADTKGSGSIFHECFKNEPVTYITTVGLYNTTGDLVAIGKTSKPIKKTADDELYLKINLSI